jgi:hypothetical protein
MATAVSRTAVREWRCPACEAKRGERCRGARGKLREANHAERVDWAIQMVEARRRNAQKPPEFWAELYAAMDRDEQFYAEMEVTSKRTDRTPLRGVDEMHWHADELTTLQRGDEVTLLILPNDDADDGEALVFPAVVAHTELRREVGLPRATWVEAAGLHGLIVRDEESLVGVDTSDGLFTMVLWIPTSTGWGEHLTLVAG